jgi:glycosyltransferase involved in cell wall biosynthesis
MNFSVIAAVNDEEVLQQCLLSSPDFQMQDFGEVLLRRGFGNAADAYNPAIAQARGEVLVFIHQDVYLPAGWFQQVAAAINRLAVTDPDWGVLGVYGVTVAGEPRGHLYCNANQCALGQPIQEPVEVGTLDEVVLIVRRNSGLQFDSGLKGFHLYGTDICLTAREQGRKIYVVPGFCIHNANGYGMFPRSFWRGYLHMRRKWKSRLPVKTPCIEIKRSIWPALRSTVWRFCWLKVKRIKIARRVGDPAELYTQLTTDSGNKVSGVSK